MHVWSMATYTDIHTLIPYKEYTEPTEKEVAMISAKVISKVHSDLGILLKLAAGGCA